VIEKSIVLAGDPNRAFQLFTARISEWWPPERRHLRDPTSRIVLSEKRFFETDSSGNELTLGAVLVWEPPARIVLDWYPGTDREHPTRVEISFLLEANATRVVVRHGPTPRSEDLFPARAPRYEASWDLVLAALLQASAGGQ
jgi:uncharacterized protein YndB with AHSA1/START domain